MASADLDYIRALLIAQTAEPEPEPKGLFGRFFAPKADRRTPLAFEPAQRSAPRFQPPEIFSDPDQELLLEKICGPAPDVETAPSLEVETASPLAPPSPRAEFGRRPDLDSEMELMLDKPASEVRRLCVLDPAGQPIGEMLLHAEGAPAKLVAHHHDERHAAPYFPEDLIEPSVSAEGQPMRPWIKALRDSKRPLVALPLPPQPLAEDAPLAKRVRRRRAEPKAPAPKPAPTFGHDMLEALALTLTREHETLADRLLQVTSESLFRPETIDAIAV